MERGKAEALAGMQKRDYVTATALYNLYYSINTQKPGILHIAQPNQGSATAAQNFEFTTDQASGYDPDRLHLAGSTTLQSAVRHETVQNDSIARLNEVAKQAAENTPPLSVEFSGEQA